MDAEVPVALIGGIFGIGAAVTTGFLTQRQNRKLAQFKESFAERNARRDYEYDALKRMYEAYEPLRFKLVDAAGSALRRVSEISRGVNRTSFNGSPSAPAGYDLKATVYQLLSPVAVVRLMDRRLTLVDLSLSSEISVEYAIAKTIARCLSDDELVSEFEPELTYTPYVSGWRQLRKENPEQFWRQGLPPGRLENAVDALLTLGPNGDEQLITFAEFEEKFDNLDPDDVNGPLGAARDLFDEFDPDTRPVLWRLLVSQILLYGCYLQIAVGGAAALASVDSLGDSMMKSLRNAIHEDRRLDMYWDGQNKGSRIPHDNQLYEQAIPVARQYYEWRVSPALASAINRNSGAPRSS